MGNEQSDTSFSVFICENFSGSKACASIELAQIVEFFCEAVVLINYSVDHIVHRASSTVDTNVFETCENLGGYWGVEGIKNV